MKQFTTLFFLVIGVQMAVAQTPKKTPDRLKAHQNFISVLMQNQLNTQTTLRDVTSAPVERVIAQSTYDNSMGSKSDSVKLSYVLNGTSTYDFNMMLYPYNYPYNTSPMFNYLGISTTPQVLFNYYSHWTINPNTLVYGFYEKDLAGYDLNNNMIKDTAAYADSTIYPNMTYVNKYNAANNIDTGYAYKYHSGISSNAFKQFFSYNAFNKITKDSMYEYHSGTWHLVSKTFYQYDASNNLIKIDNYSNTTDTTFTAPLIEQLKYINTYDASNRMLTTLTSYYDGTALTLFVKDTFAYTGIHAFHTSWKEYQYDAINGYWAPMTYMTKHLNPAGFPDTVNIQSFDSLANSWVPAFRDRITYDSYNNPVKLYEYDYNFTSFPSTPSFTTTYYYQFFSSTTSVNNTVEQNNKIKVYPNPNNGSMQLEYTLPDHETGLFTIYDLTGRKVNEYALTAEKNTLQIDERYLNNGIYFYRLVVNNKLIGSDKIVIVK